MKDIFSPRFTSTYAFILGIIAILAIAIASPGMAQAVLGTAVAQPSPGAIGPGISTMSSGVKAPQVNPGGLADTGIYGTVGIGTASPLSPLHIYSNSSTQPETIDLSGVGPMTAQWNNYYSGSSAGSGFLARFARGTKGAEEDVQVGDRLGFNVFGGWAGGAFRHTAGITAGVDTGTVSATSLPTYLAFTTTPNGSVSRSERMRITSAGNLGIGTPSPAYNLHVEGNGYASSYFMAPVFYDSSNSQYFLDPASDNISLVVNGRAGIGTRAPSTFTRLHAVNDNTSANRVAIYGETAGGNTAGVGGVNMDAGTVGFLGGQSSDAGAGAFGGYYNTGTTTLRDWGALGTGTTGVYGQWGAGGPSGYLGSSSYGTYGSHSSGNYGYLGGADYGAYGSNSSGTFGYLGGATNGVCGSATGAFSAVYGYSSAGKGVEGATQDGYGVYGRTTSTGYAGYFLGKVHVNGELTKSSGSFKIDHPQDPANKYLSHSFVESPDMKNVYDGTVLLDEQGMATVELPPYFQLLNRDFRYQLTCIGGYAPVYVAEKVKDNRFRIAGGSPGLEVSWMVTGIRQDPYANAHPIVVEQEKPVGEKGYYLNPVEWGQPLENGMNRVIRK